MSEAEPAPATAPDTVASAVLEALNATSNGTDAVNGTARFVATPEGTALAYGSLVLMALLPIFFGALRSVTCSKSKVPAPVRLRAAVSRYRNLSGNAAVTVSCKFDLNMFITLKPEQL